MAPATRKRSPLHNLERKEKIRQPKKKEREQSEIKKSKMGQEIEEIFRANKKEREESVGKSASKAEEKKARKFEADEKGKKKKLGMRPTVDESFENIRNRMRTADRLAIYSAEELGIGNPEAGGTPLCPFDCSCCF
ncbi:hypothetical protein AXF42_Ash008985 [Apostasia shenzhenica]|uniref:Uncharacterized protein n=1 Tax=Apostasia shenzhenica TaxID=1088818 RepID=A0A2I0AT19_9ASPA|nr:hypothetical protein AXF42_Ash008985 [Apostasia shenzhenica]